MESAQVEKKTILDTRGYRGTRDFYPDDQRLRNYIYTKFQDVLKSFGYEEYDGPFLEHLELYAAKSSEEIVRDQLYSFMDKGERHLAIRPEMTPTLARMVAQKQAQLPKPIRWFSVPTCMRFERPQRGRLREFDQLNVDIFGGNPFDEDVEILMTCVSLLKSFGAAQDDFVIKLNHRGIVNTFLNQVLKVDEQVQKGLLRLLDKRDKITNEEFQTQCLALSLNKGQLEKLECFVSADIGAVHDMVKDMTDDALDLKEKINIVNQTLGIKGTSCVQFSSAVMRGFDYYTGIIFEAFDNHPENRRAIFGGGRYDNLVGSFGGEQLAGVGYGLGDVAVINFMETHNLVPELKKQVDFSVLRFSENDRISALQLANQLRSLNFAVENCVTLSKFNKQIQAAQKSNAKAVAFIGDDELKNNTFAVKWLETGVQETYGFDAAGFQMLAQAFHKKY